MAAKPNLAPNSTLDNNIVSASRDFYVRPMPRHLTRDFTTYISSAHDRFSPFAEWQIPTHLLASTLDRFRQADPSSGMTSSLTWWGILQRQSAQYADNQVYTEQTLTIPLPTNTADPESAIFTSIFYMLMQQEIQHAFQQSQHYQVQTTNIFLRDWITMAGDMYRLSTRSFRFAARILLVQANVMLDLVNANVPPEQRNQVPTHRNVVIDPTTGKLRFRDD